jgi:hypothetical protein
MTMLDSNQPTFDMSCNCSGFSICFEIQSCRNDTSFFDLRPSLQFHSNDLVTTVSGSRAFISRADIQRLVDFINRIIDVSTSSVADTFVPLELGFELTIEDFDVDSSAPDQSEGTMSIWIQCGYAEGVGRTYAGAKGIVTGKELASLAGALKRLLEHDTN